ncbi:GNAT family N-acetyltransferase [uncultured Streptomyces sp.]|uniref:GNAT family N-acetyltransferase n=1 Tax=uncultured Streptomyces sp. TaxID=174707 RepID=UPI0026162681|nr:GNAT family N-acetyltransferase [uncultured Streptomyces sp.]
MTDPNGPATPARVRIEPWSPGDLDLLRRANAPELMEHLGGPETEDQLLVRHARYVGLSAEHAGRGRMFRVVVAESGQTAGIIGYWEQDWVDQRVYETGWTVLPGFHGRGIASAAARAVAERAGAERRHRYLHAFPSVDNGPSNAVCRKAGFTLLGPCDLEYPPGRPMRANDWRLDLLGGTPGAGGAAG